MSAHEIGEVETVADRAHKERTALVESGHRLAREVIVGNETATIGISGKGIIIKFAVNLVHVNGQSEQFSVLAEQVHPRVKVAGTVVAMYHCNEAAVGGCHHVNHLIGLGKVLFKHNHRERRCSGRYIAGALLDGVGGHHAGACIALGRTYRHAGFQAA